MSDKRQKNQLPLAFTEEGRSEAPRALREGTESFTAKSETESPARAEQLMEEVCERENCPQALRRVQANKGSPGIDGMRVEELPDYRKRHWPALRENPLLCSEAYKAGPTQRERLECPTRAPARFCQRIQQLTSVQGCRLLKRPQRSSMLPPSRRRS